MSQVISKPTLGELFLAEIYSHSNEKSPKFRSFHAEVLQDFKAEVFQDFHAEVRYLKDTMRSSMVLTKKQPGHAHLQIVYYNCAHCDSIANHSCVKKHRHNIEAFTKEEFDVLCEAYMNKKKLSKN